MIQLDDCGELFDCPRIGDKTRLGIRCELSMGKSSCSNVFFGESGDKLVALQRRGEFTRRDHHFCIRFRHVEKIAERPSPTARVTELIMG